MNKKIVSAITVLIGMHVQAYDIHHPDPMAFLNGRTFSKKRAVLPKAIRKQTIKKPSSRLQPGRMYVRHKEGKYIIKPEPYSISSKENDPELLGPQRTYTEDINSSSKKQLAHKKIVDTSIDNTVTKESCISLIGEEKYNSYIEKYNGESGALKRCLILKRIKG